MKLYILSIPLLTVLLSAPLFTACKKEGCTDETALNYDEKAKKDDGSCEYGETPVVTFNISSPAEGTVYYIGDTVYLDATVSSTGELHGYEVVIHNKSNGNAEVFKTENSTHSDHIVVHEMWINNVADHSDMELEITVVTDHEGSMQSKHVHFHCMPM